MIDVMRYPWSVRIPTGYNGYKKIAVKTSSSDAHAFTQDFHEYLHGRRVVLWNDFVNKDPLYTQCAVDIQDLYETDQSFKDLLVSDAERTYTAARAEEFPDKQQYIRATIADLLQQCIYLLISAKKGYRFEFYAGKQYDCLYFVNSVLLPAQEQITLVNVNISFEKR
jgi:hypothetical protein